MNISHRQLKMFVSLAKHLNFTHAAKELYVTQPAISMQIKQLEGEIGLSLFEQMGKRMFLTPAGKETLLYAKNVLQELEELDYAIHDLKGIKRGHLKLAIANSLSGFAAKLMGSFLRTYPGVNMTLEVGNRQQQIDALLDNRVDLAIMGQAPGNISVESHVLMTTPILVVAAPSHPLASQKDISLEIIGQENFIYGEMGSGTRVAMDQSLSQHHIDKNHIEVSNNEMVKHSIQEGIGIGLLPKVAIEMELKYNILASLDVQGFPIQYDINLVHSSEKRLSIVAKEFKRFAVFPNRKMNIKN